MRSWGRSRRARRTICGPGYYRRGPGWPSAATRPRRSRWQRPSSARARHARHADPQILYPVLATVAHVLIELGRQSARSGSAEASRVDRRRGHPADEFEASTDHILALALAALGAGDRLVAGLAFERRAVGRAGIAFANGASSARGGDPAARSEPSLRRPSADCRPARARRPRASSSRRSPSTARSAPLATCARPSRLLRPPSEPQRLNSTVWPPRRCHSVIPPWSTGRASTPAAASTLAAIAARGPLSQIVTTCFPSAAAAPAARAAGTGCGGCPG